MSGGGGVIGQSLVNMGTRMGGTAPRPSSPGYVAPSQLSQAPVYQPTQSAPQMSPFVQQMMMQRQMPQFNPFQQQMMGLPAALMQMQGRLNQPMMRGQMPMYQNPALGFRPNMQNAQQSLRNVAPSVAEQRRLQGIEDARRAAEEAARQDNNVYISQEN